ncbi:MAG: hypothetical protein GEU73_13610 [Chloroflexi bacterium]|nr:hypothetical protein [Chloroflexota bacterium]
MSSRCSPSGAAGSEEFVWEDGVLQPLEDGFPDREITLVVVDDPGTRDALYAVDMAEALSDISPVGRLTSRTHRVGRCQRWPN